MTTRLRIVVTIAVTCVLAGRVAPAQSVGTPINLQAVVTGTTVVLTWSPPASGLPPTSYIIEVGTGPGLSNVITFNTGTVSTTFSAANAPVGVYYIRVRAATAGGAGGASNETQATVGAVSPCGVQSPPSALTATAAGNVVSLAWIGGGGAASYVIEAGSVPGAVNLAVLELSGTQFTATAPTGTYYVRVRARGPCGLSAPSNEVTLVVNPATPGGPLLEVLHNTVTIGDTVAGNTRILGEVRNIGTAIASWAEVTAVLRSASGAAVGTEDWFVDGRTRLLSQTRIVTDTTLGPGETGCFAMLTNIPRSQVSTVDLTVGFEVRATEPTVGRGEIVGNVTRTPVSGTILGLRASGQIQNTGARLIYFAQAVLDMKNAQGRLVDCLTWFIDGRSVRLRSGVTTGTGLAAGEVGPFGALSRAQFAEVATMTAWATWDEDEALSLALDRNADFERALIASSSHDQDPDLAERWARLKNDSRRHARSLDRMGR